MRTTSYTALLGITLTLTTSASATGKHPPVNFKGCEPDKTLFFSYTQEINKEHAVEVCEVAGGYRYTFGRYTIKGNKLVINPHHSFQAILRPSDIGLIHRNISFGFALKVKNTFIWIEAETDGKVNLVTAEGGWTGWGRPAKIKALPLDTTSWAHINTLDSMTLDPFIYNNTKIINND